MRRIAILIPTYNNVETLPRVLKKARVALKSINRPASILVISDGSTDGSKKLLEELHDKWLKAYDRNQMLSLDFIILQKNSGVGATTKLGMEEFLKFERSGHRFDYFIKLDGDGQHDPAMIPHVIRRLESANLDLIICSRFSDSSSQIKTPTDRLLLNAMFAEAIRKITGWKISDARSGFMGMPFERVRQISPRLITERYGIPMEIILRLWQADRSAFVSEIPHYARYGGRTLTRQHRRRYQDGGETLEQKTARVTEAYRALLKVLNDMKVGAHKLTP